MEIKFKIIHKGGALVASPYPSDVGIDLVVTQSVMLEKASAYPSPTLVPCGVRVALPPAVGVLIVGRSSTYLSGIQVLPTVIDPGYRGDLYCMARALWDEALWINPGDRIAQMLPFNGLPDIRLMEVDELPPSDRGMAGFGSSGL